MKYPIDKELKSISIYSGSIEPRHYEGKLPCIMFFHGGGLLMRASAAHYQIAKWYPR